MKPIKTVLLAGTGAVGAAIAARIQDQDAGEVSVLAGGERHERYVADGFMVNGKKHLFPCVRPEGSSEPDLVIVAVKHHNIEETTADLRKHVGPGTLLISLMNGISSEETLAAAFGWDRVLYAMIIGIDAVREKNVTTSSTSGRIFFGEKKNAAGAWTSRVERVADFFGRAGIEYVVPEDMIRTLWYKFMINAGINQGSAVLRAGYGVFVEIPEARELMEAAMREVIATAHREGIALGEKDFEDWNRTLRKLPADGKTSMLQDVEAGRETEVEMFAGTLIEIASRHGLSVPVNQTLFRIIKTIERTYP
jgi:2-dehydropantoate 2-reductase